MKFFLVFLIACALTAVNGRITFRTLTHFGLVSLESHNNGSSEVNTSSNDCVDGVCSIKRDAGAEGESKQDLTQSVQLDNGNENVDELQKLGWSKEDAIRGLNAAGNDVTDAATFLEQEQEEKEAFQLLVNDLEKKGWHGDACAVALRESNNNVTEAESVLLSEEKTIQDNFELAVEEMVNSGWDEIVARQSLLAQWTLDQRKAAGLNNSIDSQVLKNIKPTLRKRNETVDSPPVSKPVNPPVAATAKTNDPPTPKAARKEDVIFDATASNFQKVVLESPVPVLLDVYADWCGPCKQLGPILEDAAVRAGGLFRLVKLNSEAERSLVEILQAKGLPSVYAVVKGRITDRFVGMLPGEQIQQFLIRAVTGTGKRVQPNDELQENDFVAITKAIHTLAGLASIDSKKKAKLQILLDNILHLPEVYAKEESDGQWRLHEGIKAAMRYIENAQNDIMNPKYRAILKTNKIYQEKIATYEPARKLLELAGFRSSSSDSDKLELMHKNAAILNIILQRIHSYCQEKKYAKMKQSFGGIPSRETVASSTTKKSAREKVLEAMKTPTPSNVPSVSKIDTKNEITAPSTTAAKGKSSTITATGLLKKKKLFKESLQQQRDQEADKKKHNEYFGGGSTVVLAGEQEDQQKEEEEEPNKDDEKISAKSKKQQKKKSSSHLKKQ